MLLLINGQDPKDVFSEFIYDNGDIPMQEPGTIEYDGMAVADVTPAKRSFWQKVGDFLTLVFTPIEGLEHIDFL